MGPIKPLPQANHRFGDGQNVMYDTFYSPRFGPIGCLKAIRPIDRGEELFADYSYEEDTGPKWYWDLFERFQNGEGNA